MAIEPGQPGKIEFTGPSEFAQEVTREILRQNAEILRALLNSPRLFEPLTPEDEL